MLCLSVFTIYALLSQDLRSFNWYLGMSVLAALVTIVQRLEVIYGYAQSLK
jgi:hypothetical protein